MKMSQLQNIETNEKSFSEMSFQQKRELLFLYEDKLGVIFKARHLNKIFGNIKGKQPRPKGRGFSCVQTTLD
jgi:hypothetical protein